MDYDVVSKRASHTERERESGRKKERKIEKDRELDIWIRM